MVCIDAGASVICDRSNRPEALRETQHFLDIEPTAELKKPKFIEQQAHNLSALSMPAISFWPMLSPTKLSSVGWAEALAPGAWAWAISIGAG